MKKYSVTAVIWQEGNRFVSKCPELGVASYGDSAEEARQALEEAVALYIENAKKLGILKDLIPILSSPIHYTSSVEIAAA